MRYPPFIRVEGDGLPQDPAERAEVVASRVLESLLGAKTCRVGRPGSPSGLHDYDLRLDSATVAVEVTACVDPERAQFEAALARHAIHRDPAQLTRSWEVRLNESVQVKGLIGHATPLLVELEGAGVTFVARDPHRATPYVRLAADRVSAVPPAGLMLLDLGVDTAWAFDRPDGDVTVAFLRRSGGGSGGTEHLVTAEAERAAARKVGVLSRRAARDRDERHLFVWVDADYCGEVEFALWSGFPASAPLVRLPEQIDRCWIGCWSLTPGQGIGYAVLWTAIRDGPWSYPANLSAALDP